MSVVIEPSRLLSLVIPVGETPDSPDTPVSGPQTNNTMPPNQQASAPTNLPTPPPSPSIQEDGPHLAGYPSLADKMSMIPEMAIFRRFGWLNKLDLLYRQAELVKLERELIELQRSDNKAGHTFNDTRKYYTTNWRFLKLSTRDGCKDQWRLIKKIRKRTYEYKPYHRFRLLTHYIYPPHADKVILQQSKIVKMARPAEQDMKWIQNYLESEEMLPPGLTGDDAEIWGCIDAPDDCATDLIAMLGRQNEDGFSNLVTSKATSWFKDWKCLQAHKFSKEKQMPGFHDAVLLQWTLMVSSVLASALPIISIAILSCIHSLKLRLGIIAIFNLLLSFSMMFFTNAKRTEIFATSAAFAAVQVVFVQVDTNGRGNSGMLCT